MLNENQKYWFTQLINSHHIGVTVVNKERKVLFANKRLSEISGYSNEEILNGSTELFHTSHESFLKFKELTYDFVVHGKPIELEYQFKKKDGSLFWGHVSGEILADKDEVLWTTVDITTQVEAKNSLRQEHILLESVLNTTPDLIFYKDYLTQDGTYLGCNDAFCKFVGRPKEEIIGFKDTEIFSAEVGAFFRKKDKEMLLANATVENKEWVTYPDATEVFLATEKTPFKDADGNIRGVLGISRDISKIQLVIDELKQHKQIVSQIHESIVTTDAKGVITSWNAESEALFGYRASEVIGKHISIVHLQEDLEVLKKSISVVLEKGFHDTEIILVRKSGEHFEAQLNVSVLKDTHGKIIGMIGYAKDITQKKKLQDARDEERKYLQSIIDGVDDPIMVINKDYTVEIMNSMLSEKSKNIVLQDPQHPKCYEISHNRSTPCDGAQHPCPLINVLETQKHELVTHTHFDLDGNKQYVELSASPLFDKEKNCIGIIESARDISRHIEMQNELQEQKNILYFQAHHDALTGLPNRVLFEDRLEQSLQKAHRNNSLVALFFLDIDHFKEINDSFGHKSGDELLKEVSMLLYRVVREEDTIARLGGDEFTLILEDLHTPQDASLLAEKILKELEKPIVINEHSFFVSCSIGISIYPNDGASTNDLLKFADAAMYRAKDKGRNNFQYYSKEMKEMAFERVVMEASLRESLKDEDFVVYYQPQVDGRDDKLIGMEALVRWNHPIMGIVTPDRFIPLAESTGLIIKLDRYVMKTAMKQLVSWYNQGLNPGVLAMNLAVKQLESSDFIEFFTQTMQELECRPEWVELEVTESQIMADPQKAIKVLNRISDLGIELAVDDFGTGYSSLAYLKKFPIDKLKIDQSFVQNLPNDLEDAAIAKAVIALAKSLNLRIIAEGVEDKEQKEFMVENGCSAIQGYFYSKPIPAEEMELFLQECCIKH